MYTLYSYTTSVTYPPYMKLRAMPMTLYYTKHPELLFSIYFDTTAWVSYSANLLYMKFTCTQEKHVKNWDILVGQNRWYHSMFVTTSIGILHQTYTCTVTWVEVISKPVCLTFQVWRTWCYWRQVSSWMSQSYDSVYLSGS
jgi:hypothetical protein